jgi:hypothetical protein
MSYAHFSADCVEHHDLVRDFGGPRPTIVTAGFVALSAGITANYYQARTRALTGALQRLLDAAADPDARDLDRALAHADTVAREAHVNPHTLTALSTAAALAAAVAGHLLSPSRRKRRHQKAVAKAARKARAHERRVAYLTATGALRLDSGHWERFWDTHGLDDCMRGGGDA